MIKGREQGRKGGKEGLCLVVSLSLAALVGFNKGC